MNLPRSAADPIEPLPCRRTALVTGGGKGIGAAIARRLAADGARVAILGRDARAIARVAEEIGALGVLADVTDPRAVEQALARIHEAMGAIGILVQNAG